MGESPLMGTRVWECIGAGRLGGKLLTHYCKTYSWEIEFGEQNHLNKGESRKKEYYFSYEYTGTTYQEARRICRGKGGGWDVASFQAKPSQEKYLGRMRFARGGWVYDKSVANIQKALWPLIETWDAFWVRNAENSNQCLSFYKYRRGGSECTWGLVSGLKCKERDASYFQEASCDQGNTFVCERDLW